MRAGVCFIMWPTIFNRNRNQNDCPPSQLTNKAKTSTTTTNNKKNNAKQQRQQHRTSNLLLWYCWQSNKCLNRIARVIRRIICLVVCLFVYLFTSNNLSKLWQCHGVAQFRWLNICEWNETQNPIIQTQTEKERETRMLAYTHTPKNCAKIHGIDVIYRNYFSIDSIVSGWHCLVDSIKEISLKPFLAGNLGGEMWRRVTMDSEKLDLN